MTSYISYIKQYKTEDRRSVSPCSLRIMLCHTITYVYRHILFTDGRSPYIGHRPFHGSNALPSHVYLYNMDSVPAHMLTYRSVWEWLRPVCGQLRLSGGGRRPAASLHFHGDTMVTVVRSVMCYLMCICI